MISLNFISLKKINIKLIYFLVLNYFQFIEFQLAFFNLDEIFNLKYFIKHYNFEVHFFLCAKTKQLILIFWYFYFKQEIFEFPTFKIIKKVKKCLFDLNESFVKLLSDFIITNYFFSFLFILIFVLTQKIFITFY